MNILLTGATSLIGRHVVQRLLQRGDAVTVLQRGASGIHGVREIRHDLTTSGRAQSGDAGASTDNQLLDAMKGMDAVVHLAAKVSVSGRWESFQAMNVDVTRRMLHAAKASSVPRFIHISSPSVAHGGESLVGAPAGRAEPEHARGHYARSKALGEQLVLAANCDSMRVISLRPHLVWGPGDTQLVQRIVERGRAGRLMLVGNGLALIDTTYIDNAASAIVAGIDNVERAAGRALVVSNGQPRTVREIFQRILRSADVDVTLRAVPTPLALAAGGVIERLWERLDRQDDPPMTRFMAEQLATAHWFDQSETRRLLDWEPEIGIDQGFEYLAESFAS